MKVLLLGEYSRLHNTLSEGLTSLGHHVVIVGDGDGFKNFPVDLSIRPTSIDRSFLKYIKVGVYKLFRFDIAQLERAIRFYLHLPKLKDFDVVQLINESPIKTTPSLERFLLKKVFDNNRNIVLLSSGVDSINVDFMMKKKFRYSLMNPYFDNPELASNYQYILNYTKESHLKTHRLVVDRIKGIIASDIDYVLPLEGHPKFLGLVPNPVNSDKIQYKPLKIDRQIVIFLGINIWNYHPKGISFFESALEVIQKKYQDRVKIIVAKSIPYNEYIALYEEAHILLDQVFSYDQGYNALEGMAKGKVVFTGAESEFLTHYGLSEDEVCINALPDTDYLVDKLSRLIENPDQLLKIGKNARAFIEKEHHYINIAQKYEAIYGNL